VFVRIDKEEGALHTLHLSQLRGRTFTTSYASPGTGRREATTNFDKQTGINYVGWLSWFETSR